MARILVIDDENNIRTMVKLALQYVGHSVRTASDGPDGLEEFSTGANWDVVLLDQRMPGMEGLEVLREIKRRDPTARVIMITAFGTIDLAVESMKAGARDFLRKPFTAETLRGAVQAALQCVPESDSTLTSTSTTFSMTTINGFWIESQPAEAETTTNELRHRFVVMNPQRESRICNVVLPVYVMELTKAITDKERLPGGDRFWHALCEESLANYLWQNSEFPPDGTLRIEDLNAGLRRWIEAVLTNGHMEAA